MSERGPTRIVLIDSGRYDYGEVQLDGPIQLVASNNAGKTTLIAAVQFLYIDGFQHMHFDHPPERTRRYYFPRPSSFILFECITPRGYAVVGVHGLGPVQSFDYERFIYEGAYNREDYFADRTLRRWDEIRARLADREFRTLDPGEYRRALLGTSVDGGMPLGLVPLTQASAYESFRFLFRNLLELARLNQERLKALLVDIEGAAIRRRVVDVATRFRDVYARVKRDAGEVADLEREKSAIESLLGLRERRDTLRSSLLSLWREIDQQYREARRQFEEDRNTHETAEGDLAKRKNDLEPRRKGAREDLTKAIEARTMADQNLRTLDAMARTQATFLPEMAEARIVALDDEIARLDHRLVGLRELDPKELERKLRRCASEHRKVQERLAGIDGSLGTRLSGALEADRIANLFRILSPNLLAVPAAHVVAPAEDRAVARLRDLASRVDAGGYRDDLIQIPAEDLPAADVSEYLDAESIRERLTELGKELAALEQSAKDQAERASLAEMRHKTAQQREQLQHAMADWKAWKKAEERRPALEAELGSCKDAEARARVADEATENEGKALATEAATIQAQWTTRRGAWELIDKSVRACRPPPEEWSGMPTLEQARGVELAELVEDYQRVRSEEIKVAREVEKERNEIDLKTVGRHAGATEDETFRQLRDALDALDEKRKAVEEMWRSLVAGLRSEFKGMREDLDRLQRRTRRLTKDLEARKVSNLTNFAMDFVPDPVLTKRIDTVIEQEERPLFAHGTETQDALSRIAAILEERAQIRLEDLFGLEFRVFGPGGVEQRFESLDRIESRGTTITIKVLLQLELMHGLLRDEQVRLPFFLDEVSSLDDANLDAIVAHARAMGFLPLLASPDPKTASDVTYYYLSPGDAGRLVVEQPARMALRRESHGS